LTNRLVTNINNTRLGARRLLSSGNMAVPVGLFAALVVATLLLNRSSVSPPHLLGTIGFASPLILAAVAVAPAVLAGGGGIDLSVGPLMSLLGGVLVLHLLGHGFWGRAPVAIIVVLALGASSGAVVGTLVSRLRLQPVIATLGTYLAYSGLALVIVPTPGGTVPGWLAWFSGDGSVVILGLVAIAWYLFSWTGLYEWLLATGDDDRAAYAAGIPTGRVRMAAYVAAGLMTGLAAMSLTSVIGSADANAGAQYTLLGVASVALGGVSLAGGTGRVLGAALGGVDIFLIENLLTFYNISPFAVQCAYGGILVASVCLNSLLSKRAPGRSDGSHSVVGTQKASLPPDLVSTVWLGAEDE